MYLSCIRTLPLKIAHQGTAPQKNKLHFRLLRHCSCAGCISATFSSPDPVPSPMIQASSYHRSIPPRYHQNWWYFTMLYMVFVPLFCFKQCFPVIIYIYISQKTEKWNNQPWVFASPKSTSWAPHLKTVQFPVSSVNDEKYPLPGIALVRFHPKARNAWKNFGRVMALWRDPSAPWE